MKDYYKILGVEKGARTEVIRKRFRDRALLIHPDKSGRDTKEEFIELYEAYQMLIDKKKRERYDLVYEWASATASDRVDQKFKKDILALQRKGAEYADDFRKFNREVAFLILLDLFLGSNHFLLASVALTVVGFSTIIKGVINLQLDYIILGIGLAGIGLWLAKIKLKRVMVKTSN